MNRNAWTADDRAEHDLICYEAWHRSTAQNVRTDAYLALLQDAEQAHRYFAMDCLNTATRTGAANQLKAWNNRQRPNVVAVSYKGDELSKRRSIGSSLVDEEGNRLPTQTLFDYMTREQLEQKANEYATNIRAYRSNLHVIVRLLDLMDEAPGAATPADAASTLGTSLEDYLAGAA